MNHTDCGSAPIAPQLNAAALHNGDNAAGTIDATNPVWHDGHQAGELVAELAIHDQHLAHGG